ncbi:hypothetical protein ACLKA6_015251 [Drosophila palustris]
MHATSDVAAGVAASFIESEKPTKENDDCSDFPKVKQTPASQQRNHQTILASSVLELKYALALWASG